MFSLAALPWCLLLVVVLGVIAYILCYRTHYCLWLRHLLRQVPWLNGFWNYVSYLSPRSWEAVASKATAGLGFLVQLSPQKLRRFKAWEQGREAAELAEIDRLIEELEKTSDPVEKARLRVALTNRYQGFPAPFTFAVRTRAELPPAFRKGKADELFLSSFLKTVATTQALEAIGVQVRARSGNICTVFFPISLAPFLLQSEYIEYIELARPYLNNLSQALEPNQILATHSLSIGTNAGVQGEKVLLGIIESVSLDYRHPDLRFRDSLTNDAAGTRVKFLWDQTLDPPYELGETNPAMGYGVEYGEQALNDDLAAAGHYTRSRHVPPENANLDAGIASKTHGTSVTACAASNGNGSGLVGAAPKADIIYVKLYQANPGHYIFADNTEVGNAFSYIFGKADALSLSEGETIPCVVNLSSSDNMGPHDGTTLGEVFINNFLSGPQAGRMITLSAGNANAVEKINTQGASVFHKEEGPVYKGECAPDQSSSFALEYKTDDNNFPPKSADSIEIWYPGNGRLGLTLTLPDQHQIMVLVGNTLEEVHGGVKVKIESVINDFRNGDNRITIFLSPETPPSPDADQIGNWEIPQGNWTLTLQDVSPGNTQAVPFVAWVDRNNRGKRQWWIAPPTFSPTFAGTPNNLQDELTIAVPATARFPIAVGAHGLLPAPNDSLTQVLHSPFSSCGPIRTQVYADRKPDLVAPGQSISAARVWDDRLAHRAQLTTTLSGTSFAAPIVAGAVALLFDCRRQACKSIGNMTAPDVKHLLVNNAKTPVESDTHHRKFGNGVVDLAGLCPPPPPAMEDVYIRDHVDDQGCEPFVGDVYWNSPDIQLRSQDGGFAFGPSYLPDELYSNQVLVTVHNRGSLPALDVAVSLYWGRLFHLLTFPPKAVWSWQQTGIYHTEPMDGQLLPTPNHVIPEILPGDFVTVTFYWSAPPFFPFDFGHLSLLATASTLNDPAPPINSLVSMSNNLARKSMRCRMVQTPMVPLVKQFIFLGTQGGDSCKIRTEGIQGTIRLSLPTNNIAWRREAFPDTQLKKLRLPLGFPFFRKKAQWAALPYPSVRQQGKSAPPTASQVRSVSIPLPRFGKADSASRFTDSTDAAEIYDHTGIQHASYLRVTEERTEIGFEAKTPLLIEHLNLQPGEPMEIGIGGSDIKRFPDAGLIHLSCFSDGERAGGYSIEWREEK